ncbi:MAG TPA: recombination mediator RecR [Saprospiraceae bacterium]|nr:recombination protein RecR [Saprospiraceae bacterium]MCB9328456.1 recombination protein RecR [Lewinellaceae bacterium]HPK10121.1 recombination mediator RecR [Saprospiraceae bacterium]HRX28102.1 recombination mediator RecR [Saprospiraceae bacterium]
MNFTSKLLEEAVQSLSTLPGIGKKTALRLALHLVQDKNGKSKRLANSLLDMDENVKHCKTCHSISDDDLCGICQSKSRQKNVICVVESVRDLMAIEDTSCFHGVYHILGGLISPIDGIGPSDLSIDQLIERVDAGDVQELIMAISPTLEGETTTYYITKKIAHTNVRVSTIARGVSFGGELEYADELTLSRSISARIPYDISTQV